MSVLKWLWRLFSLGYFFLLSWQLLTPVTIVVAGRWDKLYHMGAFAVLTVLAISAWQNITDKNVVLTLVGYAALTEILQHFIPGRSFSVGDWLADCIGIGLATLMTVYLLKRLRFLGARFS